MEKLLELLQTGWKLRNEGTEVYVDRNGWIVVWHAAMPQHKFPSNANGLNKALALVDILRNPKGVF